MKKFTVLFLVAAMAVVTGSATAVQAANQNCGGLVEIIATLPYEEVDSAELSHLMLMREEEKLARDIYAAMDEMWDMRIFGQIMWAEQNHMNALFALFEKYDLDLALECDGHCIKRTLPIRNGKHDPTGVVYMGEGGLGAPQREPAKNRWYLQPPALIGKGDHVMLMDFSPQRLRIRLFLKDGSVLDDFTLNSRE